MADPITATLLVSTVVAGATTAYGQYQGGQAQKAYYNYQAGVQRQLAGIATQKAGRDIMAGEQEAQKHGIQTAQVRGGTIARAGAGNVGPTTGSTADVYMGQLAAGQAAQASARQTAGERAYGEYVEAAAKTTGAGADVWAGARAPTAADINIAGTVASTAGSVAGKWYDIQKTMPTAPGTAQPLAEDQPSASKGYYY